MTNEQPTFEEYAHHTEGALSLRDVTKMLGISSKTAQKWVHEGKILGAVKSGSRWIISRDFRIEEDHKCGRTIEMLNRLVPKRSKSPKAARNPAGVPNAS